MAYRSSSAAPDQDPDIDTSSSAIFIVTVLLLFAVATTLYLGSGYVIASFASNPMFNVLNAKAELPASIPKPVTKIELTEPTPIAEPALVQQAEQVFVTVANTGGDGVFLRRTPRSADRLVAWMDGTLLEVIGEDREAEGMVWRHVKDPKGNIGWVPLKYLAEGTP